MNKLEFHEAIIEKLKSRLAYGCSASYMEKGPTGAWTIEIRFGRNGFYFIANERIYDTTSIFDRYDYTYTEHDVETAVELLKQYSAEEFIRYFWNKE